MYIPDDVIFEVFKLIPAKRLPHIMGLCKRFYDIGKNDYLWKKKCIVAKYEKNQKDKSYYDSYKRRYIWMTLFSARQTPQYIYNVLITCDENGNTYLFRPYYDGEYYDILPENVIKIATHLSILPSNIVCFRNLKELDLGNGTITTIPKDINKLSRLTYINLTNNIITEIPDELCELTELTTLLMNSNMINNIPNNFHGLYKLENLHLGYNSITSIDALMNLKSLKVLVINNNTINSIPENINTLNELLQFNVSYNSIKTLPIELCKMKKLKEFDIIYNPIESIPVDICNMNLFFLRYGCSEYDLTEIRCQKYKLPFHSFGLPIHICSDKCYIKKQIKQALFKFKKIGGYYIYKNDISKKYNDHNTSRRNVVNYSTNLENLMKKDKRSKYNTRG